MATDISISVVEWLELKGKKRRRVPNSIVIESKTGVCFWKAHRTGMTFCPHCGGVNVYKVEWPEDFFACGDCGGTCEVKFRDCEFHKTIGNAVKKELDKTL